MEDALEMYQRPYEPARPVACMDESPKQLIGEVREPLTPCSGRVERDDSVYVRNGVANLFLAFEPPAGRRELTVTETRKRADRERVDREPVDGRHEDSGRVVLAIGQIVTHSVASLYTRRCGRGRRGGRRNGRRCTTRRGTAAGWAWPRSRSAHRRGTCPSGSRRGRRWFGMSSPGRGAGIRPVRTPGGNPQDRRRAGEAPHSSWPSRPGMSSRLGRRRPAGRPRTPSGEAIGTDGTLGRRGPIECNARPATGLSRGESLRIAEENMALDFSTAKQ